MGNLYERILKPAFFKLEPETAHELAMAAITKGLLPGLPSALVKDPVELFGVKFPNRLGLAAGFDKNALGLNYWHRYGFGFVEIGTVTLHAQPGNPKPRMFRLPSEGGLINRLGFNNDGADVAAHRIARSNSKIPVGINLGKSKITPLEDAHRDYEESYHILCELGDYFVVNVSSPNTPGLRSLQDADSLRKIFGAIRGCQTRRPLLVKISPDMELSAVDEVVQVAQEFALEGIIATNTTVDRGMLTHDPKELGGLSGRPLKEKSDLVLSHLCQNSPAELVKIGVGGIMSGADFRHKIGLGASLAQTYSGWVYGGPMFAADCVTGKS